MSKTLRTSTSLLAALALIATVAVVCPCPAEATEDHGCCASEGISTADSCCDAAAAVQDETLAPAVTTVVPAGALPSAAAPEPLAQAVEHPAPAPAAFRSPPVLRI
jgi:hypothetical protein